MRLDKYLANMKIGTRSQVHKLLKQKIVSVNGKVITSPKEKVSENDKIYVAGKEIIFKEYHYFMLNKPKGVLSATEDKSQKTVLDLLKKSDQYKNLSPVGRLDKDTTGMLLITNDGQLNHNLLSPEKHVDKKYRALIAGVVNEQTVSKFAKGLILGDGTELKPAKLKILSVDEDSQESKIEIIIQEGKYHQIKRMFGANQMKVLELERLTMGPLELDPSLKRGQYRELTQSEENKLGIK